jgi:hypothetical protein
MNSQDAILFLDLDGVLIPHPDAETEAGKASFSPSSISALNHITKVSNARIVVSSMWRFFSEWEGLCRILRDEGVEGELIDHLALEFPEEDEPSCRGEEIVHWIRDNEFNGKLVVLDDEYDLTPFQDFHVCTDTTIGLTLEDADKAIAILR